jgi:hypothetical protein
VLVDYHFSDLAAAQSIEVTAECFAIYRDMTPT